MGFSKTGTCSRSGIFLFQKNGEFGRKCAETFLIHQRKINKNKIRNSNLFDSFLSVQGTNTFSEFLFVAFKQAKKQILFQVQPLKNLNKKIAHFRVTVKTFRDPAPC